MFINITSLHYHIIWQDLHFLLCVCPVSAINESSTVKTGLESPNTYFFIWPQMLFKIKWLSPLLVLYSQQTERATLSMVRNKQWKPCHESYLQRHGAPHVAPMIKIYFRDVCRPSSCFPGLSVLSEARHGWCGMEDKGMEKKKILQGWK